VKLPMVEPGGRAGEVDDVAHRHDLRGRELERLRKVGDDGQHVELRKILTNLLRRLEQVIFGDIDRHVGGELVQVFEQYARLQAGTAAELDEARLLTDQRRNFADIVTHDAELGLGRVVLRQARDFLEQLRAPFVVEVLRGNHLLRLSEPVDQFIEFVIRHDMLRSILSHVRPSPA
jgi:hypothetical protein